MAIPEIKCSHSFSHWSVEDSQLLLSEVVQAEWEQLILQVRHFCSIHSAVIHRHKESTLPYSNNCKIVSIAPFGEREGTFVEKKRNSEL